MLLAQESADLQKAIELSYYDMKGTNENRGKMYILSWGYFCTLNCSSAEGEHSPKMPSF